MSDQSSETASSVSFKEVCERVRWLLSDADGKLGAIFDDDSHHMSVQMVAAEAANGLQAVMIMLVLVESLGDWAKQMKDEWKSTVKPLVESADLDDSVRADILERIERLEYATVAEAQVERLKERLAGDVADLIADKLKGDEDS